MAGRIRTIKPEMLEDARTAELSDGAFRLFIGMLLLSDDHGRLRADVRYLTGQVFWGAPEGSTTAREDVARARRELVDASIINVYAVRGQEYAHIRTFQKHQRIDKPSGPKCPGPDEADPAPEPPMNPPGGFDEPSPKPRRDVREPSERAPGGKGREGKGSVPEGRQVELPGAAPPSPAPPSGTVAAQAPPVSPARVVFDRWRERCDHPRAVLDHKRRKAIEAALERHGLDDCLRAVEGCRASPFHMGDNDRGRKFDDIELILRDAKHVEEFLGYAERPPAPRPRATVTALRPAGGRAAPAEITPPESYADEAEAFEREEMERQQLAGGAS
jgi:hypothetical protein